MQMDSLTIIGDSLFFKGYEIAKFNTAVPATVLEDAQHKIDRRDYGLSGTYHEQCRR